MRHARVKAVNLKVGDVVNGMRIGQRPLVHTTTKGTTVHFFVSNHGKIEAVKLAGDFDVVVKRPVYNLTRKPRQKVKVKEKLSMKEADFTGPITDGFDGNLAQVGGYDPATCGL